MNGLWVISIKNIKEEINDYRDTNKVYYGTNGLYIIEYNNIQIVALRIFDNIKYWQKTAANSKFAAEILI